MRWDRTRGRLSERERASREEGMVEREMRWLMSCVVGVEDAVSSVGSVVVVVVVDSAIDRKEARPIADGERRALCSNGEGRVVTAVVEASDALRIVKAHAREAEKSISVAATSLLLD